MLGDKELELPPYAEFEIVYKVKRRGGHQIEVEVEWGGGARSTLEARRAGSQARPGSSKTAARKVFATFKDEPQEAGSNWSRWYKLLTEKINSGDIYQVAEVVRESKVATKREPTEELAKEMDELVDRLMDRTRQTLRQHARGFSCFPVEEKSGAVRE